MTAPADLKTMEDLISFMHRVLEAAEDDYKWMYPLAYERANRGGVGRNRGVSRPVESIGAAQSHVRAKVKLSSKLLRRAAQDIAGAWAALQKAANDQDVDTAEHTPADYHDTRRKDITPDELARAQAAQERRALRREGYGAA